MDRAELEALDRDALIAKAEDAGVSRARILTRPELVDELLLRSARAGDKSARRARGFFGRARDLLASVIELGLNLPDAAERLRAVVVEPPARTAPAALPTVTLAEIYAAQGHRERAIDTLERVLEREPDHAAARALLAQLAGGAFPEKPAMAPEEDEEAEPAPPASEPAPPASEPAPPASEPAPPPRAAPPRAAPDADALVALPQPGGDLVVKWETRAVTLSRLARAFPAGRGVLRILVVNPTWDGPRSEVRDLDVEPRGGERVLRGFPAGAIVRTAIGWRTDDGFAPIAHA